MADSKELQTQLDLQNQINSAISARAASMKSTSQELSTQVQLAIQLCKAMECEDIEQVTMAHERLQQGLEESQKAAEEVKDTTVELDKEMKKNIKTSSKFQGAMVGAFVGIKNGAESAMSAISSIGSLIGGLVKSAWNIGQAILGAFNSMAGGLIDAAQQAGAANKVISDAWEEVRESFGSFESNEGKAVKEGFASLRSSAGELAESGASLSRVFGTGPDGVAAQIQWLNERAQGLGPTFSRVTSSFKETVKATYYLNLALGVSDEAINAITRSAMNAGEDVTDALQTINRQAAYMEKKFGISAKVVGKNFSEMVEDVESFGDMTRTQMMAASAWVAKMGVSLKSMQGILGKTDDFESAAEAAAFMGSTFGMQIDTMDLMTKSGPEKMMMIRDAFHATGKAFEDMSRQEKARLSDLAGGMQVGELQSLLDPANADIGLDEFEDAANEAADGAITQAEANKMLSKSIKKLNEVLGGMAGKKGFFGTFFEGMTKGIMNSAEMKDLLADVSSALATVFKAGRQVGTMLMTLFGDGGPLSGVMNIFQEYFSPEKWKKRMEGVVSAFKTFTETMRTDPSKALGELLGNLKSVFIDDSGRGSFMGVVKEGLMKLGDVVGSMIIGAIPTILKWVQTGLTALLKLLKGGTAQKEGKNMGKDVFMPMIQSAWKNMVKEAGPILDTIWESLKLLWGMFWDKYGGALSAVLAGGFGLVLMKGLAGAMAGGALGGMIGGFFDRMSSLWGGEPRQEAKLSEQMGDAAAGFSNTVVELAGISKGDMAKALLIAAMIAGFVILGIGPMSEAIADAAKHFEGVPFADVAKVLLTLVTTVWSVTALVKATGMLSTQSLGKSLPVLGAMLLMIPLLGVMGMALMKMIEHSGAEKLKMSTILKFLLAITAIVAVTAGMVFIATTVGLLLAGPQVYVAAIALGAMLILVPAIALLGMLLIKMLSSVSEESATRAATTAMAIAESAGSLAKAFIVLLGIGLGALLGGGIAAAAGIAALGGMIEAIVKNLVPSLETLAKSMTSDPDVLGKKVDIIIKILDVIEPIAGIGVSLAKIGEQNPEKAIRLADSISGVFDSLFDKMKGLIDTIVCHVQGFNMEDIKKAASLGSLLSAISDVLKAVMPNMDAFQSTFKQVSERSDSWIDPDTRRTVTERTRGVTPKQIAAWGDQIRLTLEALGPALLQIIAAAQTMPIMTEGGDFEKKMKTAMMSAEIAGKVAEVVGMIQGGSFKAGGIMSNLYRLAEVMSRPEGNRKGQMDIKTFLNQIATITFPDAGVLQNVSTSLSTVNSTLASAVLLFTDGGPLDKFMGSRILRGNNVVRLTRSLSNAEEAIYQLGVFMNWLAGTGTGMEGKGGGGLTAFTGLESATQRIATNMPTMVNGVLSPLSDAFARLQAFAKNIPADRVQGWVLQVQDSLSSIVYAYQDLANMDLLGGGSYSSFGNDIGYLGYQLRSMARQISWGFEYKPEWDIFEPAMKMKERTLDPLISVMRQVRRLRRIIPPAMAQVWTDEVVKIADAYVELGQGLTANGPMLIDATVAVQRFADALAIGKAEITVNREPLNIQTNITVNVSAHQLAEAMVEGEYLTANPNGPLADVVAP